MHRLRIRIFDFLVFLLIVLPVLTGGIWIARPHLKLELAELAVPTLIIFLLGFFLRADIERSWFFRKGSETFRRWREFLTAHSKPALAYGTVFVALLESFASLRRHWNLQTNAFDLGIFTNAIWNLTHGNGYISSVKGGISLFADHQSPIFWVLAPIFALFPYPETLLVAQGIGLATGAAAVFVIAKQYREDVSIWVAALPLLYWAYLPVRNANAYDFHPEIFMLPLFLWAVAGIQSGSLGKKVLGALAFVGALACKESAGPIAVGIGTAWVAGAGPGFQRNLRAGVPAVLAGLAVFFFDLKWVPAMLGGTYVYGSLYQHLARGPAEWIHSLFGLSRLKFLFATLAPLGFLPLLAPRALIAAAPGYLMLFLSEGNGRVNPQFHYGIEVAVGLFWAAAASSTSVDRFRLFKKIPFPIWVGFWALLSFGRSEFYWIRRNEPSAHTRWLASEMLRCVSPLADVSWSASSPLVPQLANRRWVQEIPDFGPPHSEATNDCILIDRSVKSWPISPEDRDHWEAQLQDKGYEKAFECGPTRVYQRQHFQGACLRCLPPCQANGQNN